MGGFLRPRCQTLLMLACLARVCSHRGNEASLGQGWGEPCTGLDKSCAFSTLSLGELLEESQMEASRLRQKAEELVKDSELPPPPPAPSLISFDPLAELTGTRRIQNPCLL